MKKNNSIHLWPTKALEMGLAESKKSIPLPRVYPALEYTTRVMLAFDKTPKELKKDVCAMVAAFFTARRDVEDDAEIMARLSGGRVITKTVNSRNRK